MISLEQIRILEQKVESAVARIRTLSTENRTLKESLERYEGRIHELESMVSSFKAEQDAIEAGIVSALQQLDDLEHTVGERQDESLPAVETAPDISDDHSPEDPPSDDAAQDASVGEEPVLDEPALDEHDSEPQDSSEDTPIWREAAASGPADDGTGVALEASDQPATDGQQPEVEGSGDPDAVEGEELPDDPELDIF